MSIDFPDFTEMAKTTSKAFENIDWTKAKKEMEEVQRQMQKLAEEALVRRTVEQAIKEAAEKARIAAEKPRDASAMASLEKILKKVRPLNFFLINITTHRVTCRISRKRLNQIQNQKKRNLQNLKPHLTTSLSGNSLTKEAI
ncbi:hypothetical protein [Acinetobacter nosocomialis]|uniref:hypothetical protein n=1 Tax=Acinetobacter nosocomialis TaxID=106654 RepID=UPI0033A7CB65